MRLWVAMLSLVVVVGLAVAQDNEKPVKAKSAPKTKQDAGKKDSVELDLTADPNALGKKATNKKEMMDKVSYAMGRQLGLGMKQLQEQGFSTDMKRIMKGLQDAVDGNDSEFTDEEIQAVSLAFQREIQAKMMAKQREQGGKNRQTGEEFLEANKDKKGVKTLPSGLQYSVLATGTGASPAATDKVRVHYRGKLTDGKMFDQSYKGEKPTKAEQPAEFRVNGVIKGWTEALKKMKVGDKWQVFIPPDLGYGEEGSPDGSIGPNAVLIFDVELLEIVK